MSFIFLIVLVFAALLAVAYFENPELVRNRNINRLVRESLQNERMRERRRRRCYQYVRRI